MRLSRCQFVSPPFKRWANNEKFQIKIGIKINFVNSWSFITKRSYGTTIT